MLSYMYVIFACFSSVYSAPLERICCIYIGLEVLNHDPDTWYLSFSFVYGVHNYVMVDWWIRLVRDLSPAEIDPVGEHTHQRQDDFLYLDKKSNSSRGRLNIKMSSYGYMDLRIKNKTVSNSHNWESRFLYWDVILIACRYHTISISDYIKLDVFRAVNLEKIQ